MTGQPFQHSACLLMRAGNEVRCGLCTPLEIWAPGGRQRMQRGLQDAWVVFGEDRSENRGLLEVFADFRTIGLALLR
jgi:hypothetical protein